VQQDGYVLHCCPLVAPNFRSWPYVLLNCWNECSCVTRSNELIEELLCLQIYSTKNPLLWNRSALGVSQFAFGYNAFVDGCDVAETTQLLTI
jgi:hypothetical protein